MRKRWIALLGLAVGLCGCLTTDKQIKPPTPAHEFILPPSDDPRFSNPPAFPDKTLNNNPIRKDTTLQNTSGGRPGGMGGSGRLGSGMGPY